MKPLRPLCLSILAFAAVALGAETGYYLSDQAAFQISPIEDPSRGGGKEAPEFYLRVETEGAVRTRTLFEKGKEKERRVTRPGESAGGTVEELYKGGVLAERTTYGARRETLEERAYEVSPAAPGAEPPLLWKAIYTYTGDRLTLVERFDAEGASLGALRLRYDPRGRLVELQVSGVFGEGTQGSVPGQTLPRLSWTGAATGGLARLESFDEEGRVVAIRILDKDKVAILTRFEYDAGGLLLRRIEDDLGAGTRTTFSLDSGGRPLLEEKTKGKTLLGRREYTWDEKGNPLSERRLLPAPSLQHLWTYADDGSLLREEFSSGGLLYRVVAHTGSDSLTEETWAAGALVVKAYFVGGFKVREEFYKDGVVQRERRYR